jgi:hypothetical protein
MEKLRVLKEIGRKPGNLREFVAGMVSDEHIE